MAPGYHSNRLLRKKSKLLCLCRMEFLEIALSILAKNLQLGSQLIGVQNE